MRKRNAHITRALGVARRVPRIPFVLSFALLAPLAGCMPGEAAMFINDVKNFYLNGGLTSGATDGALTPQSGTDEQAAPSVDSQAGPARVVPEDGDRPAAHPPVIHSELAGGD